MAREDLNPVEEARACALLVEELGLTREDVGRRVGRSRVAVSNLLRLLDLPDEVLDLLAAGHLSEGHGRALLTPPTTTTAAAWPARRSGTGACARPRPAPAGTGRRASHAARRAGHAAPRPVEAARRLGDALPGARRRRPRRPARHRLPRRPRLADPAAADVAAERLGALDAARRGPSTAAMIGRRPGD